jgi:hypothetical protein
VEGGINAIQETCRPCRSFPGDRRTRKPGAFDSMTDSGKRCTACQQWLPLERFEPIVELRSGLDSWCRRCRAERTRQWREENPEYLAEYNERRRVEYRAEHPLPTRPCVVCGQPFTKRGDALVCGERCRSRRKYLQRKATA